MHKLLRDYYVYVSPPAIAITTPFYAAPQSLQSPATMASSYSVNPGTESPGKASRHLVHRDSDGVEDPMLALKWYHPHLSRHAADCMLIDNAPEGSYLRRPSTSSEGYVVSVKLSSSVQHIKVEVTANGTIRFGNSSFGSVGSLRRHFELEKPVIGGDSGVMVALKYPYTRYIDESHLYTEVVHHAVTHMLDSSSNSSESTSVADLLETEESQDVRSYQKTLAISSKEGYLTKQGRIRKSWRVRWFVLRNQHLSYYKAKQSEKPIAVLNLTNARGVEYDQSKRKDFCFRITFSHRTYFLYANSSEDCEQWVELLRSKLQ